EGPPNVTDTTFTGTPQGDPVIDAGTISGGLPADYSTSDVSSPHGGRDVSGGSVDNDPSSSTDPFSPTLPGFAGILDAPGGGTDGPVVSSRSTRTASTSITTIQTHMGTIIGMGAIRFPSRSP